MKNIVLRFCQRAVPRDTPVKKLEPHFMKSSLSVHERGQQGIYDPLKECAVIIKSTVSKTDGGANGGGVLTAIAATKSPIIFLGTGDHMDELEVFEVKPFVSRLLGMGEWSGFMEDIHEVVPMDQQSELVQQLSEGQFAMRFMYEQYEYLLKKGPISQVFAMLPEFNEALMPEGGEEERKSVFKRYLTIMDSMTDEELDSTDKEFMNQSRVMRVARVQVVRSSGRSCNGIIGRIQTLANVLDDRWPEWSTNLM